MARNIPRMDPQEALTEATAIELLLVDPGMSEKKLIAHIRETKGHCCNATVARIYMKHRRTLCHN